MRVALFVLACLLLAGCTDGPGLGDQRPSGPIGDSTAADAQTAPTAQRNGSLDVHVADPRLRPLEGAEVSLSNNASVTSDADGLARFDAVAPGTTLITVRLDGYRTATSGVEVVAGRQVEATVKLLASEAASAATAPPSTNSSYREQFHFRGYFECSATYLIITGDCMLIVDTVTGSAGFGTPAGDMTDEEYTLDFPLDRNWTSIVGEMHWNANGPGNGEQMTFALEPTEYNTTGHAPKYARAEGVSPLRWVVHAGEAHPNATASADGDEPDMPNPFGGEVVRTRSYVAGQFLHRPAGTNFLGIGAAVSQQFEVAVTVFYGERAPQDFTVAS